jgi:hypothetical protein
VACRQHFEGLLPPEYAEAFVLHALKLDHDEGKDNVIFCFGLSFIGAKG